MEAKITEMTRQYFDSTKLHTLHRKAKNNPLKETSNVSQQESYTSSRELARQGSNTGIPQKATTPTNNLKIAWIGNDDNPLEKQTVGKSEDKESHTGERGNVQRMRIMNEREGDVPNRSYESLPLTGAITQAINQHSQEWKGFMSRIEIGANGTVMKTDDDSSDTSRQTFQATDPALMKPAGTQPSGPQGMLPYNPPTAPDPIHRHLQRGPDGSLPPGVEDEKNRQAPPSPPVKQPEDPPQNKALRESAAKRESRPGDGLAQFKSSLAARFDEWDKRFGGKGYLTEQDIDELMEDASIKGGDAATVATLKELQRKANGKGKELHVSREGLTEYTRDEKGNLKEPPEGPAPMKTWEQVTSEASMNGPNVGANDSGLQDPGSLWLDAKARLDGSSHDLFASPDGKPNYEAARQGKTGSCYFISTVTAMAQDNPEKLRDMIQENVESDGTRTYTVTFPGCDHPITVKEPTDAELAHFSGSGSDGMWLTVLEKAYGQKLLEDDQKSGHAPIDPRTDDSTSKIPSDRTGIGGNATDVIKTLTGCDGQVIPLRWREVSNTDPNDVRNAFVAPSNLYETMQQALLDKRLVLAGSCHPLPGGPDPSTGSGSTPQLRSGHEFSVLAVGVDENGNRTVTLRDPHGNFGENLEYLPYYGASDGKNDGIVTISYDDFLRYFSGVTVEQPQ